MSKFRLIHQQLTLPLGQNAKQKAVLHFVLRVLFFDTVGFWAWKYFQVNWIVPEFIFFNDL
jgi:hypothetical protein